MATVNAIVTAPASVLRPMLDTLIEPPLWPERIARDRRLPAVTT
jgi:hypothetical protein